MTILFAAAAAALMFVVVVIVYAHISWNRRFKKITIVFDDDTFSEKLRGVRTRAVLDRRDRSIFIPKLPTTPSPYDRFYVKDRGRGVFIKNTKRGDPN